MTNSSIIKTVLFLAGIIIGLLTYQYLAAPKASSPEKMVHSIGMHMNHETTEATSPSPTVSALAYKDSKDGYNLKISTTNFTWTPERVNDVPVQKEGHAHVYVNDVKVARVYGAWFHIPSQYFVEGKNTIRVTLNTNSHSEWVFEGKHIQAEVIVEYTK